MFGRHCRFVSSALVVLVAGLCPAWGSAAVSDASLGEVEPLVALFPGARTAAPPAFLQPGLRVTYQTGAATFGTDGIGGGGVIHNDILSMSAVQTTIFAHSYGDVGSGVVLLGAGPRLGYPGIGPFWINPAMLVGADQFSGQAGLTVMRYEKTLADGTKVNAVRFIGEGQGSKTVTEFNTASGILLFHSSSTGGSASQLTLVSTRPLPLPWQADRAPNWVRPGAELTYTGTRVVYISGVPSLEQGLSATIKILDASARWSVGVTTLAIANSGQSTVEQITGYNQGFNGHWVPRAALSAALPNQPTVFDTDPITGLQLSAHRDAQQRVVVSAATQATQIVSTYDAQSGALLQTNVRSVNGEGATDDTLTLGGGSDLNALAAEPELAQEPAVNTLNGGGGGGDGGGGGGCHATPGGGGGAGAAPWWTWAVGLWGWRRRCGATSQLE